MKPHTAAEVLHMIADGHKGPREFEEEEGVWQKATSNDYALSMIVAGYKCRLAPRTIKIGDVEVPAPERVAYKAMLKAARGES